VTDATKAMIATGLIDRGRIAIMGGSFGGYLAVSGVVHEPALYRCAITNAGVFDWAELIQDKNEYRADSSVSAWLIRKLGEPKKQQERFEAISPLHQVDQIRVPVLVAGGKDDQNVEITQSKRLISALKKNHVPYETFLVSEEGHGMRHLNNQVELYTRILAFLDKYLKPVAPVAAP
jgi:dipeptidyl aminopeptidase/acylaminoacyl peptidase